MSPEIALVFADRLGVFVFAITGGLAAVRKEMDLFGVLVLAFLPAVGGGTIRDLVLDQPVFWLEDTASLWFACAGGLAAFFTHKRIDGFKPLTWADALGLSLFAVTGAAKAFSLGHGPEIVVIMGMITASAGGLLRDVVANRDPLLLREDIYATAAMLGSGVYYLLVVNDFDESIAFLSGAFAAFILRGFAITFGLSLPKPRL